MADGRKKGTKETGTVPKVKYWKNSPHHETHVTNNLSNSMLPNAEGSHLKLEVRNGHTWFNRECFEDSCLDDTRVCPNYNSLPFINMSGGTSPSASGSTSRRHSGGIIRKCDNVTKYPDKKQIEEKLNQIREYLKVTSSLMSNVKEDQSSSDETDDLYQMLSALQDSERKLEALLVNRELNQEECSSSSKDVKQEVLENNGHSFDTDIPFAVQNNVAPQNELEYKMEISEKKLQALHDQQNVLLRLQEKAENQLKDARKVQERLALCASTQYALGHMPFDKNKCVDPLPLVDSDSQSDTGKFQDEISILSCNEDRDQLLQFLDARDSQLCVEQSALQQKLQDLNSKKQQIDQLVSQLHNYGNENCPEDGDDMANQIRQIVAMKEQLATLKDMLSAVKSTEAALLQNSAISMDPEDQLTNVKSGNIGKTGHIEIIEAENRPELERRWSSIGKQSNKSSISSSREQLQLHAELQAKKQELEELMYKDQDHTSAINQDVCNEMVMNKSDAPFILESLHGPWTFLQDNIPPRDSCVSQENVYSSDEEELDSYPPMNNAETNKVTDHRHCKFGKQSSHQAIVNGNVAMPGTATNSSFSSYTNPQVPGVEQKQLELMMNLCQSLLDQQQLVPAQVGVPNFQWFSSHMQMQQALMLSTISQCCQLLWMQQQDINNLINTVSMMQQNQKYPCPLKVSQTPTDVTSACSMPNLTTRLSPADTEYAGLARNGECSQRNMSRNSSIHVIPQPQSVWTGVQALNNQVAPGNRANNYWDNFRSYSRQNLLSTSTKSNEGSQNSLPIVDRSNVPSVSHPPVVRTRSQQSVKRSTPIQEMVAPIEMNNQGMQFDQVQAMRREERLKPNRNRASYRNRNEWSKDNPQPDNSSEKSKLFDVLRENVYKEVTQLISANESRPHFLIQLFRDLQLISSDPLRRSALYSIQSLITESLSEPSIMIPNQTQENFEPQTPIPRQVITKTTPIRSKSDKSHSHHSISNGMAESVDNSKLDHSTQQILMELLPFLKFHNEEMFHSTTIDLIKMMIFQLLPSKNSSSNNKLRAKLDSLLEDSLKKYQGRRILEIKEDLLKTIANILLSELPIKSLSKNQQNPVDNHQKPNDNVTNHFMFMASDENPSLFDAVHFIPTETKSHPNQLDQKCLSNSTDQKASANFIYHKTHPNFIDHKGHPNYADQKIQQNFVDHKSQSNFVELKSHPNFIEQKLHGNFSEQKGHPNFTEHKIQSNFMDLKAHPNFIEQKPNYVDSKGHPNYIDQKSIPNCIDHKGHSNFIDPKSPLNLVEHKAHPNYSEQKTRGTFMEQNSHSNFSETKGQQNVIKIPRVDNGDLAEADQSRREAENEEGAVGGVLVSSCKTPDIHGNNCDVCFP